MLGGVFTSVVVPMLVRAAKEDADRGEGYAKRIYSLGVISLLLVTIVATLLAQPIASLYGGNLGAKNEYHLTVVFAYFFIPQIFFYGMDSLLGAILNVRGRFGANMWTPVINNVVVIIVGLLFLVTVGRTGIDSAHISGYAIDLLGHRDHARHRDPVDRTVPRDVAGRLRHEADLRFRRAEIAEIRRVSGWMFGYVFSQWLGNLVVTRVANGAPPAHRHLRLRQRLPAVPAPLRDRRHLGHQRAAAPDERARQRPALLPRPGRLLQGSADRVGDRGARRGVPRRARRPAVRVPLRPRADQLAGCPVHRRGIRRVLPRPAAVHADPAPAAGVLRLPREQDPGRDRHGHAGHRRHRLHDREGHGRPRAHRGRARLSPTTS